MNRIKSFLASPQGRRTIETGRRAAADPRRRQQVQGLFARFRGPRRGV